MQIRKSHRILAAVLALVMAVGMLPTAAFARSAGDDGSAEMNEAYAAKETLMPIGPSFNVKTLLEWTPESDPDAMYSRASIKLADRKGGFVVNPVANPEAKLMLCAMPNNDHDNANAQGSTDFFSYSFNYWQYTDSFVYWSGSEEGLICCPTGEFVDAAHTNGVPVVATLGFPWGSGSGYVQQVKDFVQKAEDGSFPVADKLIEVMDYYGFDGYFFNQESYGCSAAEGQLIDEMMRYMHKKRPNMLISWYDSMLPTGGVSYQNAVNDSNKQFMTDSADGTRAIDEFFMNYNWYDSQVTTTISTMKSIGRSQFDAFAGINVQENCMNSSFQDNLLVDADGMTRLSLALYCPNSTLGLAKSGEDFHEVERTFYTNAKADPRDTSVNLSTNAWAGMSRFFADHTVILDAPFVTDFNSGHGRAYYVDGVKSRDAEWSYQSTQDVMPTWTWIIDSEGEKLEGGYDFTTAWNGGNSIKFSGSLSAGKANDIMLYSTIVEVTSGMKLGLTYKGDQGKMKLVAYYGNKNTASYEDCTQVAYDLTASIGDWTTTQVDLSANAGKTLYAIGLKIESDTDVSGYQVNLGRLTLIERNRSKLTGSAVTLDEILYTDGYTAEARIYWSAVTGASSYEIYKVNADGSKTLIMETPNTAYYIPALSRAEGETDVTIEVVPLNRNGDRGTGAKLTIDWAYADGDTEKVEIVDAENVCLGATVTAYSNQGDGAECDKALDGSYTTKWWANGAGDWMAIDLGRPCTIKRWLVGHGGSGGEGEGMNHHSVSLHYKDADGQWVQAKRIDNNYADITDVLLDEPVTAQEWKLTVNQIGSSPWGAVNIYEWQMFESDVYPQTEPVPMRFASAVNGAGATDTFTLENVPSGQTVKVYTRSGDTYTEIGSAKSEGKTVTLTNLDFGTAEAGQIYYTTTASGSPESARLCVRFEAENAEKSAAAQNVSFKTYSHDGSVSSSSGSGIYTSLTVTDLSEGDVVYVYENGANEAYTKVSQPVAAGKTSTQVDRILVERAGGELVLRVKRAGKLLSDAYTVTTPAFAEPTATVILYATNEQGETLTGVRYELVNAEGKVVTEVSTTSDSGGKGEVPLGTYTLNCKAVPDGYKVSAESLKKLVTIEGWTYELHVVIEKSNGTVEPTDPEPTDPEPTDPEPSEPVEPGEETNLAKNATVVGYNGKMELDGASGPNRLFDGRMENADTDKWCEDGKNIWVAFDIGTESTVNTAKLYHAGANNEWTPSPGATNTSAYELYTLNTEKISVEELLAKTFSERTTLLADNSYWTLIASRTGNKDDITTDTLTDVTGARIFKINISATDSTGWGPCVRLYELELYGYKGSPVDPEAHAITVSEDIVNGTVSADKQTAVAGETVTLTVTPDEGYVLKAGSLKVNGTPVDGTTFTMPATDAVITAEFQRLYTVTVSEDIENGTVTADKSQAIYGETVTLTVTPDAGYVLDAGSLCVNGVAIDGTTFTMPDGDAVITASFSIDLAANAQKLDAELEAYSQELLAQGYSEKGKVAMQEALDAAKQAVHAAATIEEQEAAAQAGKAAMDAIPTLKQELQEVIDEANKAALAASKYAALMELNNLDFSDLTPERQELAEELRSEILEKIDAATTVEEVKALQQQMHDGLETIRAWICAAEHFTDVDGNAWYHKTVDYMYNHGLLVGTGADTFTPNRAMTRGELITLLYRIAGEPEVTGDSRFDDVVEGKFYSKAVIWADRTGIAHGYDDGNFYPNYAVSRQDMVVFLYRFAQAEQVGEDHLSQFPDADAVSYYAKDAVNWAVANGILYGAMEGDAAYIQPKNTATRAEAAAIVARYLTAE